MPDGLLGRTGVSNRGSGLRIRGGLTGLAGIPPGKWRSGAAPRIRLNAGASSGLPGLAVSADRRASKGR
ncbi:MAG TPA: hypothetical protein VKS99_16725, partial [Blastocatellia bacterium]|nr:hypothetical protein [Blastocatellia bacterium]